MGHGGAEHTAHRTGADADREAPEQVHLPKIANEDEAEEAGNDEKVADEHHAAGSVAIDKGSTERAAESEGEDAERDRE